MKISFMFTDLEDIEDDVNYFLNSILIFIKIVIFFKSNHAELRVGRYWRFQSEQEHFFGERSIMLSILRLQHKIWVESSRKKDRHKKN